MKSRNRSAPARSGDGELNVRDGRGFVRSTPTHPDAPAPNNDQSHHRYYHRKMINHTTVSTEDNLLSVMKRAESPHPRITT